MLSVPLLLQAASREVERDFDSVYSRLVLCKTYRSVPCSSVLIKLLLLCTLAHGLPHPPVGVVSAGCCASADLELAVGLVPSLGSCVSGSVSGALMAAGTPLGSAVAQELLGYGAGKACMYPGCLELDGSLL